jgi:hypothetical protein
VYAESTFRKEAPGDGRRLLPAVAISTHRVTREAMRSMRGTGSGELPETKSLGVYRDFDIFAQRKSTGAWRVIAIHDELAHDGSAERSAFVSEDPLLEVAEAMVKSWVDRWRRPGST